MVLSWVPCIYMADSGMVHVEGLGLPSLLVCRITATPAQFCRCLLAIRGFWYGAEEVATHGTSSELFHRATVLRADVLMVKHYELPLHPGLYNVACAQPWALVLPLVTSQNLFPIVARAAANATTGGPVHSDISPRALWGRAHPGLLMKTLRYYSSGDFVRFLLFLSSNMLISSLQYATLFCWLPSCLGYSLYFPCSRFSCDTLSAFCWRCLANMDTLG